MAVYPIQELKNLITDRIIENHERRIDGIELQEVLLDVLDSLESYTDNSMESPAENYYVNQILWDANIGALTLVRAGGITPLNISVDLDGRYRLASTLDNVINLPLTAVSGAQTIDVSDYSDKYRVLDITVNLVAGIAGIVKAGLTLGGDEILMATDLSYLSAGEMVSIYAGKMFTSGQNTIYVTMDGTGESFDISVTLIRFKP